MPRVSLQTVYSQDRCTLKDVAGGFGTAFQVGTSPGARLLEYAKKRIAHLPPITVAYLVSMFEERGWDVDIASGPPGPGRRIAPADLFLVYSSITDCQGELQLIEDIKTRYPSAKVGVYGTMASMVPDHYDGWADFVVKGEVEAAVDDIATGQLSGLYTAGFLKDIDELPYPAWYRFPYDTYRYSIVTPRGITLPMLSARGCAYTCGYCPYTVNAKFRERDPEAILDEIYYNVHRYGMHGISFRDPLFNLREDRVRAFADALLAADLNVYFSMEARTDRMTTDLIEVLHRSGMRAIEFGIDSVDTSLLKTNKRKPPDQAHQEEIIETCHRLGVRVIANFCFGLPGDDPDKIRRTMDYAERLNTFAIQFTVSTPYPGTKLYHQVKDEIFDWNYENWNGWTNVYRHESLTPGQLHALREEAYVGYHFRPRYAWRFLQQTLFAN